MKEQSCFYIVCMMTFSIGAVVLYSTLQEKSPCWKKILDMVCFSGDNNEITFLVKILLLILLGVFYPWVNLSLLVCGSKL